MCHDKEVLDGDKKFQASYSTLYAFNRLDTLPQKLNTPLLLLRRTLYVSLALSQWVQSAPSSATLQIYGLFLLSTVTLLYNGFVDPFISKFDRKIQQFNEFMIGLCTLALLSVHPGWNILGQDRVFYSWMLVVMVQVLIVVNMTIVL